MELLEQVKLLLGVFVLLSGLTSGLVTLAGVWFVMRFKIGLHDDQIGDLNRKISNDTSAGGLTQQIQMLKDTKLDTERFEGVLFNSPGALQPQFAHMASRLTRVETICRERHSKDGQHTKEHGGG